MKKLLPPVLVALLILVIYGLSLLAPLGPIMTEGLAFIIGLIIIFTGLALLLSAAALFAKARTNINTFKDPGTLVEAGPFRFTRNPMYLGFFLITLGVAIMMNEIAGLIGPVIFFLAANFWYIPFEEKAAAKMFGPAYEDYKSRVRRWL